MIEKVLSKREFSYVELMSAAKAQERIIEKVGTLNTGSRRWIDKVGDGSVGYGITVDATGLLDASVSHFDASGRKTALYHITRKPSRDGWLWDARMKYLI